MQKSYSYLVAATNSRWFQTISNKIMSFDQMKAQTQSTKTNKSWEVIEDTGPVCSGSAAVLCAGEVTAVTFT